MPWLRGTCKACRFCAIGRGNLCLAPTFTAWDADGGFAPPGLVDTLTHASKVPKRAGKVLRVLRRLGFG